MSEFNVLNLVTHAEANFFRQQVETLERNGVETTTLSVPGERDAVRGRSRSVFDYLRFYPTVLRQSSRAYDLVHANNGLTAPAALAQPVRPVVVSLWGSDLNGRYGRITRACAARADAVIVMSEEMNRHLDVEAHVIPHGVDFELFRPRPREDARAELGWRADARHVLFPYPPDREVKDFPRAKRVVEAARKRLDDPVELQTILDVPHERMPTYMNAADALLLTSRWEGSPNTVKEALACNLPVVSTDVGDVRERLADVSPSRVGRTDDQLVAALVEVLERGDRSNGRATAGELSLEVMGERILAVYRAVTSDEEPTATLEAAEPS